MLPVDVVDMASRPTTAGEHALPRVAREFEAVLLSAVLRPLGESMGRAFGGGAAGGIYSDLFTGFTARALADQGGIGLQGEILAEIGNAAGEYEKTTSEGQVGPPSGR